MQPLTHHEIITIVEPFTRRGRHVDLAASNRLERCIAFKPLENAANTDFKETLKLENPHQGTFRLTRSLQAPNGMQAALTAEGPDAGELLKHIESVAPQRQFTTGNGFTTALSFRFEAWTRKSAGQPPTMILTDAQSQIGPYTLSMRVPRVSGVSADIELALPAGVSAAKGMLPEDLLAVIGWDWAALRVHKDIWTSKLRLRGGEPKRSASAEAKLDKTLRHLVHTLSQPPAAFHARHTRARWGVVFRRGIPLLTVIGMFVGVAMLPRIELDQLSPMRMLMFNLPTLLLALAFSMQELPRFEIPPLPRRLKTAAWPGASDTDRHPDTQPETRTE
jgi:hypothetical protein